MFLNLSFEPLKLNDCHILCDWLQLDHVKLFWDDGDRNLEQVINHYMAQDSTKRFLFYLNQSPAGYIQTYIISNTKIGIDFFIGNTNFFEKEYATSILNEFIRRYHRNKTIIVDPEINNHKAIHIYQKAGFIKSKEFTSAGKNYQLMIKNG